jgi:hypothetical protein
MDQVDRWNTLAELSTMGRIVRPAEGEVNLILEEKAAGSANSLCKPAAFCGRAGQGQAKAAELKTNSALPTTGVRGGSDRITPPHPSIA